MVYVPLFGSFTLRIFSFISSTLWVYPGENIRHVQVRRTDTVFEDPYPNVTVVSLSFDVTKALITIRIKRKLTDGWMAR